MRNPLAKGHAFTPIYLHVDYSIIEDKICRVPKNTNKKRTIKPNDIVETDYCSSFRCLELIVVSSHLDRKIRLKFVYISLESPCSSRRIHPDITIDEILLILLAVVAFKSISRYPARRLALLSPTRIALESLFELS